MGQKVNISFVVPVYNGAQMVEALCDRLVPLGRTYGSFEIILVDDGSSDNSCEEIRELQRSIPELCFVELSRNFGQHNATLAGLAHAQGEFIVTLDQDLQHPPEEVPRLIEKLEEGFDVAYGLPEKRPHTLFRNLASDFSKWLSSKILSTALGGNFSSFRVIRSWVAAEVIQYNSSYIYLDGFISWTTAKVAGVVVPNPKSEYQSEYTFFKLMTHGLNLLVNFSIRPLQIASVLGFAVSFVGLLLAAYIVVGKLFYGESVQGWTSLIVVVLVIGGLQMAFMGLIGEYMGRVLMNTNRAPSFIVREISRGDTGKEA
jgi:glycosyltransferase involved in cell wall biosynthesis